MYPEDVNQGTVVERELSETDYQSEEDTDHEDEMDDANKGMVRKPKDRQRMPLRDLYIWLQEQCYLVQSLTCVGIWYDWYGPEETTYVVDIDEKLPVKVFSIC